MKEVIAAQCSAVNVDGVSEAEVIGAVKEYLSQPNDQGETALMAAVRNKNLEMVKELIKYGADLSVIGGDLLNRVGGEIQEYLNEAIEAQEVMNGIMERSPSLTKDDWKTIEGFVDEGLIDINFMDQNGNTLSGLAYDHGELDMWRKLVRAAN
jgi:ankyrin repeat protein